MEENELKKLLGARIKELRTKKGLTQEELAEKIHIGERNLSKIECGEIFFTLKTFTGLINTLEAEPKEIFDFSASKDEYILKETLINGINENKIDIGLMYRIYRSIKN